VSHPRALLDALLVRLRGEFPDPSLDWVIEAALRNSTHRRCPDIAAYRPDGSAALVVEVGYTDAVKLKVYREHGVEMIRWYCKALELQHEEVPGSVVAKREERLAQEEESRVGRLVDRNKALSALDLWTGADVFLRDIAKLVTLGYPLSDSPDIVNAIRSNQQIHETDLRVAFPQGFASVSFEGDCCQCECDSETEDEASGAPCQDEHGQDDGLATYTVCFDYSGYLEYDECHEAFEHSSWGEFTTWDDDYGQRWFDERRQLSRLARNRWCPVIADLLRAEADRA